MYNGPVQITKKKIIEVIILVLVIIWVLLFMVNYVRYTRDEPPILAIHTKNKCDDGIVHSYSAFGYTYRKYDSTATNYTEFVPFWIGVKKCETTNGLPATYKNYPVPNNPKRQPNYRGLVYLYVNYSDLIGAYKCINTDDKCTLATSGIDEYDFDNVDVLNALKKQPNMGVLYNRFAFIDDSITQEKGKKDSQYIRTIYYYDSKNNVILDRFADVRHSNIDKYGRGVGDKNNYYIVRNYDNRKWGIVYFKEDGTYENVLDFEYDSINYNIYTGYYILGKDDKWSVYDMKKKDYIIKDSDDVIYDIWENNNMSFYYKIGNKSKLEDGKEIVYYKIIKLDGSVLLDVPNVWSVVHTKHMIMYWTYVDNKLHFMDYVANDRVEPIQLYFKELDTENNHFNPAFTYEFGDDYDYIFLKVYQGRELKYEQYYTYGIFSRNWK